MNTPIPYPTTAKDELISKLVNKSLKLSYSSLKNFTSPKNFIDYKLKGKIKNDSMIFGSLCDCLLLTPDRFEKNFKICDSVPTTDNQKGFAADLIEIGSHTKLNESIIQAAFERHYSRGDAMKTFEGLKDYIEGSIEGKEMITSSVYNEAKELTDNLLQNEDVMSLFSQVEEVQKYIEFDFNGWTLTGFLDTYLEDHIVDLKFTKDANPEKFERDIMNLDYFLQAAVYCLGLKTLGISENPRFSFLVFDKTGNFSFITLDVSYLIYGQRKLEFLIQELERCICEGAFDMSYNFFKRVHVAYKPKWAKGFQLNGEDEE